MRHFDGNSKCSLPLPPLNKPSSGCFAGFLQTIDKWTAGNREKNSTNDRNILQRDKCCKKFVGGRNPFDIPYIGLTNNEGNAIISKSVRNQLSSIHPFERHNVSPVITRSCDNAFTKPYNHGYDNHNLTNIQANLNNRILRDSCGGNQRVFSDKKKQYCETRQEVNPLNNGTLSINSSNIQHRIHCSHEVKASKPNNPFSVANCSKNKKTVSNLINPFRDKKRIGHAPLGYSSIGHPSRKDQQRHGENYVTHEKDYNYVTEIHADNNNISGNNNEEQHGAMIKVKQEPEDTLIKNCVNEEESSLVVQLGFDHQPASILVSPLQQSDNIDNTKSEVDPESHHLVGGDILISQSGDNIDVNPQLKEFVFESVDSVSFPMKRGEIMVMDRCQEDSIIDILDVDSGADMKPKPLHEQEEVITK